MAGRTEDNADEYEGPHDLAAEAPPRSPETLGPSAEFWANVQSDTPAEQGGSDFGGLETQLAKIEASPEYAYEKRIAELEHQLAALQAAPRRADPVAGVVPSGVWSKPEYAAADEARQSWLRDVDVNDQMGALAAAVDAALAHAKGGE